MTIQYTIPQTVAIELNPGDRIKLSSGAITTVERIVQNARCTYIVLGDSSWRPASSYGKKWWKE